MSEILENDNNAAEKDSKPVENDKLEKNEADESNKKTAEEKSNESDSSDNSNVDESSDEKSDKESKKEKKKKEKKKNKEKDDKKSKEERKPEDVNIVKDLLWLVVYIGMVILICFLIIKFVGCRSRVDGSSMNPTLTDGDNLWVDKLSYTFGDPKRFDVVIFYPNGNENVTYVKRIIGLPGETVTMDHDGKIYINGQLLNENYALDEPFIISNLGILSGENEIVLGEDEYFVLGDNRNNSMDSRRSDPGNVKRDYIIGKVVLRIYPLSKFGFID